MDITITRLQAINTNKFVILVATCIALLLGICVGAMIYSFRSGDYKKTVVLTSTPTILIPHHHLVLYTVDKTGIKQLTSFTTKSNNPSVPTNIDKNDNVYFVEKNDIVQFNVKSKQRKSIYHMLDAETLLFNPIVKGDILYISKYIPNTISNARTFIKINILSGEVETIEGLESAIYGGFNYLGKMQNTEIIGSFGGDGCGGSGVIYRYTSTASRIIETGDGCNPAPRYKGVNESNNSILLLSVDTSHEYPDFYMDKLYGLNVFNLQQNELYDFKQLGEHITYVDLRSGSDKAAVLSDSNTLYIINLDTKRIENKIKIKDLQVAEMKFINDTVYLRDITARKIDVISLEDNAEHIFIWPEQSKWQSFDGAWQGKAVFYQSN